MGEINFQPHDWISICLWSLLHKYSCFGVNPKSLNFPETSGDVKGAGRRGISIKMIASEVQLGVGDSKDSTGPGIQRCRNSCNPLETQVYISHVEMFRLVLPKNLLTNSKICLQKILFIMIRIYCPKCGIHTWQGPIFVWKNPQSKAQPYKPQWVSGSCCESYWHSNIIQTRQSQCKNELTLI